MDVLMDGLLATATLFAAGYCWVLGRRVRDLKSLDKGLGGAIVTLTRQVELARTTLDEARAATGSSRQELGEVIARADTAAGQLRLLLAATRDLGPRSAQEPAQPAPTSLQVAPWPDPGPARPASLRQLDPAAPEVEAEIAETDDALLIPKPRALPPLDNPLRRRAKGEAVPSSEEELLQALSTIAGSGGR